MNEDERMTLDPVAMFPEAARRVKILEELRRSWPSVVGLPYARYSKPLILGVKELVIVASNEKVMDRLKKSKGNILRFFSSKCDYRPEGDFFLRLINVREMGNNSRSPQTAESNPPLNITVDENKVREYMKNAPETLPEDINYALSHLVAFLDKFPTPR